MASPHELRSTIKTTYLDWTSQWGLALAFGITQSVEKSETIIESAIVALITTDAHSVEYARFIRKLPRREKIDTVRKSVSSLRFAEMIVTLALKKAYTGFGADSFFKLSPITRAIVILKLKAQFTNFQISKILKIEVEQIEEQIENARLNYSSGKSWIQSAHCNDLALGHGQQPIFTRYLGRDCDLKQQEKIHIHLQICSSCRDNLTLFKKNYTQWSESMPIIEADSKFNTSLTSVIQAAFKVHAQGMPRLLPSAYSTLKQRKVWSVLLGIAILALLYRAI